ncbi:MAG: aminoacyl-tRNA deacylase [Planctomycetota bacterium]|jgi:Ala-tRNA(Pro) deacylase
MKLESLLKERGIDYMKHTHVTTYTAQGLAHEEHVSGYMVAKPVVVKGAADFAMCVLPAPAHLDLKRVAEVMGESEVRLATEAEMAELFQDCELGAEPPVGSLFGMRTFVDARLKEDEFLIMQAGTHTESIELRREDWEKLCDPVAAAITLA